MSIPTPDPSGAVFTPDQIAGALSALGGGFLLDPQRRPDGPTDAENPALLGALLAAVETAVYQQAHRDYEQIQHGWFKSTTADARLQLLWWRAWSTHTDLAIDTRLDTANIAGTGLDAAARLLHLAVIEALPAKIGAAELASEKRITEVGITAAGKALTRFKNQFESFRETLRGKGYDV